MITQKILEFIKKEAEKVAPEGVVISVKQYNDMITVVWELSGWSYSRAISKIVLEQARFIEDIISLEMEYAAKSMKKSEED